VSPARLRGVVNLALLVRGGAGVRALAQDLNLPPKLARVVILRAGPVRAGEDLRAALRVEYLIDRRDRAIVQIGRGGPDAVQRRGLVAGRRPGREFIHYPAGPFLSEPAPVVVLAKRPRDAVVPVAVGADDVKGHDLVGISPACAVGAVATRAILV